MDRKDFYESLHSQEINPWNYCARAVEILRHRKMLEIAIQYCPDKKTIVLETGSSTGNFTKMLCQYYKNTHAVDISDKAIEKAKTNCFSKNPDIDFKTAGASSLPFETGSMECVIAADGLYEWYPDKKSRIIALQEIERVLSHGGYAIFSDYLKTKQFDEYIRFIADSPLNMVQVFYLHDRLWYQFESWFKSIRRWNAVRIILSSIKIAKILRFLSKLLGRYGSRHIVVVAEKYRGTIVNEIRAITATINILGWTALNLV